MRTSVPNPGGQVDEQYSIRYMSKKSIDILYHLTNKTLEN